MVRTPSGALRTLRCPIDGPAMLLYVTRRLLLVMLVMEAAFGIVGVVAAPIYYAYLKDELVSRGLI